LKGKFSKSADKTTMSGRAKQLGSATEKLEVAARAMIDALGGFQTALNDWGETEGENNTYISQFCSNEDFSIDQVLGGMTMAYADLAADVASFRHYEINSIEQYGATLEAAIARTAKAEKLLESSQTASDKLDAKDKDSPKAFKAREALVTAKREDTEAQQLAVAWREEYESVKHGAFKHGMNSLARSFRRLSVSTSDGFEGLQGLAEATPDRDPSSFPDAAAEAAFAAKCTEQKAKLAASSVAGIDMIRRPGSFLLKKPEKRGNAQSRFFQLETSSIGETVFAYYATPPTGLEERDIKGMIRINSTSEITIGPATGSGVEISIANPERTWGLFAKTYAEAQWWITILKAGAVGGPDGLPPPAHFYDHTEKKAEGDAAGADAAAAAEGGAAAETKEATAAAE